MKSFKQFINEDSIDYMVVQVPVAAVDPSALLNEGKWVESKKSGWMQRVEAENPAIKLQRHVHVARSKHISNKNQQASWNEDGSRHDKKTFNDKVGSLNAARTIAREALGLSANTVLEEMQADSTRLLTESCEVYHQAPLDAVLLTAKLEPTK